MEENNIFEGTIEEAEVVAKVTGESMIPVDSTESTDIVETTESTDTSDLVGKLAFAGVAAVVGGSVAYYLKNKPRIQAKKAAKIKAREEKKAAKSAAKIARANAVLQQYSIPEEITEECETVTVTTTE